MDQHIKMLLVKLSSKYKITVTTVMYYDDEKQKFHNLVKLYVKDRETHKTNYIDCYGKRSLIVELMKWLKD